jgi:preprotein translocase subunit YajC
MILATEASGVVGMVLWIVILIAFMYFFMIRPQKKEQQQKAAMLQTLEIGDTVLTTSGFYGTVIDMSEDTVIIEFGNHKNCRIPMQRAAIAAVEKPEDAAKAVQEKDKKDAKK